VALAREKAPVLGAIFVVGAIPVPNFLERHHPLLYDPPHLGQGLGVKTYSGNSLIRNTPHLGPYSRAMSRDLW